MLTVEDTPRRGGQFATANRQAWDKAAAAVLRKVHRLSPEAPDSAAWAALACATPEGITIPPLGLPTTADAELPEPAPGVRGAPTVSPQGWDIRVPLVDQDPSRAASDALDDLENGATSIWLTVGGPGTDPAEMATVLDEVFIDMAPISMTTVGQVIELDTATRFATLIRQRGIAAAAASNLGADPIGRTLHAAPTGRLAQLRPTVVGIAALATDLKIYGFAVDGTTAHDAGAGDSAELGYSLAAGIAYIRELAEVGVDLSTSLRMMEFRYAATVDQFATIAKLRAARALWYRVAELCGADLSHRTQVQHAVTSRLMMTRYDPWVNLLRTTVAAFAAGVSGADSVTVLPFDSALGVPDRFGRRLARNISSLLINEAHVAKVIDPAGGAYAIEALTDDLADAGWNEFQRIEAAGGINAVIADGSLLARYTAAAAERHRLIALRKLPITGVTEFPNQHETLVRRPQPSGLSGIPAVPTWAHAFEVLRDQPMETPVLLATLGTAADHTVRAVFADNVFAAGGVKTVPSGPILEPEDASLAYELSGGPVVCLAGSDSAYATFGRQVITALRLTGAQRVILAGRPPVELAEAVDDHFAAGEDVLQFLQRTRQYLALAATR